MDIKTEAECNNMFDSTRYDDQLSTGMFAFSDAIFSAVICLYDVAVIVFLLLFFVYYLFIL